MAALTPLVDYDHANRRDVLLLAQAMLDFPEERRPAALARLYDERLIHSNMLMHMVGAFGSRILLRAVIDRVCHGLPTAIERATRRSPQLRDEVWTAVIEHLVQGQDTHDERSAGGFGADELSRLIRALRACGWDGGAQKGACPAQEPDVAVP